MWFDVTLLNCSGDESLENFALPWNILYKLTGLRLFMSETLPFVVHARNRFNGVRSLMAPIGQMLVHWYHTLSPLLWKKKLFRSHPADISVGHSGTKLPSRFLIVFFMITKSNVWAILYTWRSNNQDKQFNPSMYKLSVLLLLSFSLTVLSLVIWFVRIILAFGLRVQVRYYVEVIKVNDASDSHVNFVVGDPITLTFDRCCSKSPYLDLTTRLFTHFHKSIPTLKSHIHLRDQKLVQWFFDKLV